MAPTANSTDADQQRFSNLLRPSSSFLASVFRLPHSIADTLVETLRSTRVVSSSVISSTTPQLPVSPEICRQLAASAAAAAIGTRCSSRASSGGLLSCQISGDLFFRPLFQSRRSLVSRLPKMCRLETSVSAWASTACVRFCCAVSIRGRLWASTASAGGLLGLRFGSSNLPRHQAAICAATASSPVRPQAWLRLRRLSSGLRSLGVSSSLSFCALLFSGLCSSCGLGVSSGLGFSGFLLQLARKRPLCVSGGLLFSQPCLSLRSRQLSASVRRRLLFCGVYSFSSGFCIGPWASASDWASCFADERLGRHRQRAKVII